MPNMEVNILIHKSLSHQISQPDQALLDAWLAADPSNQQTYEEIKSLWEDADQDQDEITDEEVSVALRKLEGAVSEASKKDLDLKEARWTAKVFGSLTLALAVAFAVFVAWPMATERPVKHIKFQNKRVASIRLEDGSVVLLNDSSQVEYVDGHKYREASLTGEAMFEIKREDRPFKLKTTDAEIEVIGTSFVVKAYPGKSITVVVISGKVNVSSGEKSIQAQTGETASVVGKDLRTEPTGNRNFNSWYTGILEFNDEPLGQVLDQLENQYNVQFSAGEPQLMRCGFTGRFENAELDDVLRGLSYSLNVQFSRMDQNSFVVSGDGCLL